LVIPRALMLFYDWDGGPSKGFWTLVLGGVMLAALAWGCFNIIRGVRKLHRVRRGDEPENGPVPIQTDVRRLHQRVLLPLLLAAGLVCWFAWDDPDPRRCPWLRETAGLWLLTAPEEVYLRSALAFGCAAALFFGLLHGVLSLLLSADGGAAGQPARR